MTLDDVEAFLEEHEDVKLSFGLEYSSVVDWVAEFVPRRGHPLCRDYNGPWATGGMTASEAIERAKVKFLEMMEDRES